MKNKCCLYVVIHIRLFSITICNLLIDLPSYIVSNRHRETSQPPACLLTTSTLNIKRLQDTETAIAQSVQRLATGMYGSWSPSGRRDFLYPSRPALRPNMGTPFPEEKRTGSGVGHPLPSKALAFMACYRAIFTFFWHTPLLFSVKILCLLEYIKILIT